MSKKLRLISILIVLLLLSTSTIPAFAQDYSFGVENEQVNVYVNSDGTATINYVITFTNNSGAHIIDYIDMGMPNDQYNVYDITATVDGKTISDISTITNGFTLALGANAIGPGESGTVKVTIPNVGGMFYTAKVDNKNEDYASFEFSPNYFGSEYVTGSTIVTVTLYLPAGLQPEEPIYFTPKYWPGNDQPESGYDSQGRVFYRWSSSSATASDEYIFGAAFPARLIPADTISTPPVFNLSLNEDVICPCAFILCFGGFFAFTIYSATIGAKKRKLQYLPPKIALEGHGIKRGLTSVEAAVLMETPLDRLLTMILFSLVKKDAAHVVTKEPLELEIANPLPEGLYPYEIDFLKAFKETSAAARRKGLQDMMVNMVKNLTEKMKGFSRKETIDYYTSIIEKAWQQVEASGTPEVRSEKYAEVMDWTMLDRRYEDRTKNVFGPNPVFLPTWWGYYDPTYRAASSTFHTPASATSSVPSLGRQHSSAQINMPSLPGSDFAASIVGGVQNFSKNTIGDLTAFTGSITDKTNPVPKPTYTSGRGGGGGGGNSCACACACAGCACACAGGGR